MQKEYKEIFTSKKKALIKSVSQPTSGINKVSTCINKFHEFKNSLKSLYNLESQDLMCDNRIINFMEGKEVNTQQIELVENFFLETSIDMYREIFKK
jgi:hypothetical protein